MEVFIDAGFSTRRRHPDNCADAIRREIELTTASQAYDQLRHYTVAVNVSEVLATASWRNAMNLGLEWVAMEMPP